MKGLDTNVLLAWLLDGHGDLETGEYRVSLIVLAELVWVLERSLGFSRKRIAEVAHALVNAANVHFPDSAVVTAALDDYAAGPAGLADYLIARENLAAGCTTTLTLDRKAARHPAFTLAA